MKKAKIARRILATLMLFVLLAGFVPMTASAATVYTGQMTTGDYSVSTAGQLQLLATAVNAGTSYQGSTFTLLNDIDLNGVVWTPIGCIVQGEQEYEFGGVFDGGGYTISNLVCSGDNCCGLFGAVIGLSNAPGEIKDLNLKNVNITGNICVGGICGYCESAFYTFSNCSVSGTVSGTANVGGIAGFSEEKANDSYGSTFSNCYVNADITATGNYAGGICGMVLKNVSIANCYASGTVACGGDYAGGLTGNSGSHSDTVLQNAFALQSSISGGAESTGRITGDQGDGSILVCYAWEGMTIGGSAVGTDPEGKNGANMTAAAALTATSYLNSGWSVGIWSLEDSKLPYITNFGEVDPSLYVYLTSATGGDETAPTLSDASCTAAGATYVNIRFTSDEAGNYYCLALPATEPQPDTDMIKASGVTGTAQTGVNSISVGSLTASTSYVAYLVVTDVSANNSSILSVPFTTGDSDDITVPPYINGVYQIGSANQLCWFRDLVNGVLTDGTPRNTAANAVLTADIDLSSVCNANSVSWTPIGNSTGTYTGAFDGGGHVVSNLYINTTADNQALFGAVGAGTVKDLTVQGSVYSTGLYVAGIAGSAAGSVFTGCRNEAAVSSNNNYIGGVAGNATGYVRFEACVNNGDVSGRTYTGGIAGSAQGSAFEYCINAGSVTGQDENAGGIAGRGLTFLGCKNVGVVTGTAFKAGGIVGATITSSALTRCENTASVTGSGSVGGIAGHIGDAFTLSGCTNSGEITGLYAGTADSGMAGGLFGDVSIPSGGAASSVTGSFNTGNVTDLSGTDALGGVGGIGGAVLCAGDLLTIMNCYSTGSVSGVNSVGGLLGSVTAKDLGTVAVTNCYSAASTVTDTSGNGSALGGAVGQTALTGSAADGAVFFSNLFYMDCGAESSIGDDSANADVCSAGVKTADVMKTQLFVNQLGGAFTFYADGIAEIAGEPPAGAAERFSAYGYPILRSWLELDDNETFNVQFTGAAYTDVTIDSAATYATTVTSGQSITFTVSSKYAEVTLVSVSSGGTTLTPDGEGNYTLSNITVDTVVTVVTSGQPDTGGGEDEIYDITFTTTPANASVTVTGSEGDVTPEGGVYKLKTGNYTYTVSADGYITKTGSFTVSGDAALTVTLTAEGAACTVTLDSSVAVNVLSDGLVVGTVPGDQSVAALELGAGTYTYETDGWGAGSFTVSEDLSLSLRKADFSAELQNDDNVLYTMSIVDGNGVSYMPGGTTLAAGDARARFLLPVQNGKVAYNYTINVPSAYWASCGEAYIYADTNFLGLNLSDGGKFVIASKISLSVTVPEGSELIVYQRPKFYRPYCLLGGTSLSNGDGTETYTFDAPAESSLVYELKLDGYVKKSDVFTTSSDNKNMTIPLSSLAPMSAWSGDVKDASQNFYEANLLMNVNDSKYLALEEDGEYELYLFRAWQAVDSITSNNYVDPDYHYEVIYGDSVEIVNPYYAGATIKAVPGKTGLSVVKITYDALDHCGQVYSRLWTENTGIVVVNVGSEPSNTTIDPGITLTDFDTAYYIRSINGVSVDADKQYAEYTFTPTAESTGQPASVTSVRVHEPLGDTDWTQNNWNADTFWTDYTASGDGSYTVNLTNGRNVIEICAGNAVTYHTVNAYGTDVTISGAEVTKALSGRLFVQVETGSNVEISFDELRMPIAKLGAIANPGYPDKTYLVYTMDNGTGNGIESVHCQYAVRTINTITLPAFSTAGQHSLTDGKIHTTAITSGGFTYRDITKGSSSNSDYVPGEDSDENVNGFFSILPDIEFTVVNAKTNVEKVIELIDAIGTVTIDSADAINAARDAYDALSDEEKAQVTNYDVLLAAEEKFEEILKEAGATPVFTRNITGASAEYKVGDTAEPLQVQVSVADLGTLTYQWYVMTASGGGFAAIPGAVSNYFTPSTEVEGTFYYKVIVTNVYDGTAYTAESGVACIVVEKLSGKDMTHTTSYYPTTGLSFNMNGKSIAGYVTVSFMDYGIRTNDSVDFATPLGVLILPTQVPYASGDTIATVTLRLLDALDIEYGNLGSATSSFYLASIDDFFVSDGTLIDSFGEFDAGGGSGWMITWNNWFINMGASEFDVDNGDLIEWQYTCQLGSDIGCSMSNPSAEITGITFGANYGQLTPSFSTETEYYTYTIPSTVTSICLEALQANYWAQLTYTSGGVTYKPMQPIPISNGTVITLDCNYYNDYTNKAASLVDSDTVTIMIKVEDEVDAMITPSVTAVDGKASVTITSADITEAINIVKETGGDIIIAPQITGIADTVSVELPKVSVSSIASQTEADLLISTPVGTLTVPNAALASIASQTSGSTVTMSLGTIDATTLSAAQQEAVGDSVVYDISIMSGDQNITSFGGNSLTLSLPYTLKDGEDPSDVTVWYLNDAGELTEMTCTYDETTGTVSFATDHLSYYVVGCSETDGWDNPFSDVAEDDWFYEAVEFVCSNGLFNGTNDTLFSPDMPMTRAMLVTVLYRLEGEPVVTGTNSFEDVESGLWYADAVIWASNNSIVAGYGDGLFGINDHVTREQLATILYRYAKYKGYDVSAGIDLSVYTDVDHISDWASRAMKWANAEGLITGVTSTALEPLGSATRAQVATIFMRFADCYLS